MCLVLTANQNCRLDQVYFVPFPVAKLAIIFDII